MALNNSLMLTSVMESRFTPLKNLCKRDIGPM